MWHLLHSGADRTLQIIGWTCVVLALGCLLLSGAWHWPLSPLSHPGTAPDEDRAALLAVDVFRWGMLGVAAMIAGVRQSPPPTKAMKERHRAQAMSGWMVVPVVWLGIAMALAAISTGAWFFWMDRLPGGNRTENIVLALVYAVPPWLLIVLAAYGLIEDRPEPSLGPTLKHDIPPPPVRRRVAPPPPPMPEGTKSAQDRMAAKRKRKGESDGWG